MPGPVFSAGETVELRTVEEEDLDFLQRTINDPQVRATLGSVNPINGAQEREWFESLGDSQSINLLLCVDETPVGSVNLKPPMETWGVAEIGIMLAPEYWSNGYGTEAVELLCGFAFEERRLNKVFAITYSTNPAIWRILEKLGFEQEGVLQEEAFSNGEYVDLNRYGLLASEWFAR